MTENQTLNNSAGVDVTPNKDGGILKEIIKEGAGDETPYKGDTVVVHYIGTLTDGSKFDSSRDREEKFKFEIGQGNVIKGWDIGVATMKRGERASFTIRADYGYGATGSGEKIPPNSTLVFDIELFDFHGEDISKDEDKSLIRRVLEAGQGYSTPNDGARVEVALRGTFEKRVFDERKIEFEIGEGSKVDIIPAIEEALLKFKKGERSKLDIKSRHAWGVKGSEKFNIPPFADVQYEVTLVNFEKAKDSWELNSQEKLDQSELSKNKGTELFKEGKYALALKKYRKVTEYLEQEVFDNDENKTKANQLLLAAHLNIAACELKLSENSKAIESCEKALKLDSNNEKALFRIAQAHLNLSNFEEAIKYFNRVLEANQDNAEARKQLTITKQKYKEYNDKEKKLYAKMFANIAKSNKNETDSHNGEHNHNENNTNNLQASHATHEGCCA